MKPKPIDVVETRRDDRLTRAERQGLDRAAGLRVADRLLDYHARTNAEAEREGAITAAQAKVLDACREFHRCPTSGAVPLIKAIGEWLRVGG